MTNTPNHNNDDMANKCCMIIKFTISNAQHNTTQHNTTVALPSIPVHATAVDILQLSSNNQQTNNSIHTGCYDGITLSSLL
jgi:hypothetical protein